MLGIVAAVLFFISFLINAADISTNDVFTSTNVMLIGLALLALHVMRRGQRLGHAQPPPVTPLGRGSVDADATEPRPGCPLFV